MGNVGLSLMQKFAWLVTSLLDDLVMSLTLIITLGSALGTFLGNTAVFWLIGTIAQRQAKKQEAELSRLREEFLEVRKKEAERMERYAKMEG